MLLNMSQKLSSNFTLGEFIHSDVAWATVTLKFQQLNYCNNEKRIENITKVALALQELRNIYNIPIHINSGIRCPELNTLVGGVVNSKHLDGLAADISCRRVADLQKYWHIIKKSKVFDVVHSYYKATSKGAYIHLQLCEHTI